MGVLSNIEGTTSVLAVGTAGLSGSKAATISRTVALVNASDAINSTTALNNFSTTQLTNYF